MAQAAGVPHEPESAGTGAAAAANGHLTTLQQQRGRAEFELRQTKAALAVAERAARGAAEQVDCLKEREAAKVEEVARLTEELKSLYQLHLNCLFAKPEAPEGDDC